MAAPHYRFKAGSLAITAASGGDPITVTGVTSLKYGEGGEVSDLMSNASELVEEMPLHSIKGSLSVSSLAQAQDIALGAYTVTFDIEQVKTGRGAASGADKTVSFGNAVLKSKSADVNGVPGGGLTLEFDAADDGDGNIYTIADAA
jgi:hypothetical protein